MLVVAGEHLIDFVAGPDAACVTHEGGAPYDVARALVLQSVTVGHVGHDRKLGFEGQAAAWPRPPGGARCCSG
jgi:hypothetical protein